MNNLDRMCDALASRIAAAGISHWMCDNEMYSTDNVQMQAIIDAWGIYDAIVAKKQEIARYAKDIQDRFVALLGYSAGERDTWAIKRSEAEAFQAGGGPQAAPTLLLETSATRSLENVVTRVLSNAAAYSNFAGAVAKNRGIHQDAVSLLTDYSQINNYNYFEGWPNV